jgi:uncharacterized protein (TIGR03382 family)
VFNDPASTEIYTRTGDLPTIAAALALLAAAWLLARRERPDGPDPDPST